MHYWNESNFNGLKSIGESYLSKNGYEGFANYCLLREKGLKKPALIELKKFIANASSLPPEQKRSLACELSELSFYNQHVHQLIPQPLTAFIVNALKEWCAESPVEASPYRWLAIMDSKLEYFEAALRVNGNDRISTECLARQALNDIDFQTHHLSESKFIGSEADAEKSLAIATEYVMRLQIDKVKEALLKEITDYQTLLSAWNEYRSGSMVSPFPDWCCKNGYEFSFWSVVYYDKD
jgi:hypothetical protein